MAGSFISVDFSGQNQVSDALKKLADKTNNLKPVLAEVGEYLLDIHEQRFKDQVSPDGEPWQELALSTKLNAKRPDRILREEGTLADTLTYQIGDQQLQFGTNVEYGATHQFGRDHIPARPFLGLSESQKTSVLDIITSYLKNY